LLFSQKDWSLDQEPDTEYEIRVCVHETKNIPMMDFEGVSDVYIQTWIEDSKK